MSIRSGLGLIRRFEGCKLKAYRCPAGVVTIGYGFTSGVRMGDVMTQEAADIRLVAEYDEFERKVSALVNVPLSEGQLGALTCFAFNIGVGALKSSTLLKLVNASDFDGAVRQFARWTKAGGRVLPGLVTRRAAEAKLFAS